MSNCVVCHKPVKSGIVVHSECMELLQKTQQLEDNPLTMDELQNMDGEPVYLAVDHKWYIVSLNYLTPYGARVPCGVDMWGQGTSLSLLVECGLYRRKPNDWISVERRLPPDPDESIEDDLELPEYIVMVRGATESTVMHYAGYGEWLYGGDPYPVTHWMPMPEPPEVE